MRVAVIATLVGASLVGVEASAQTSQTPPPAAPPLQPILAGKKIVPPLKGQADVDYIKPKTERKGAVVVTKVQVKNMSSAPIARLKIIETWFDKGGGTIPGGEGVINGLLQPGDVQTIEIQTPYSDKLNANSWNFVHANGTVKPHLVKSFDQATASKEPANKSAATSAKSSKKKSGS
jgi:hypothetical protein